MISSRHPPPPSFTQTRNFLPTVPKTKITSLFLLLPLFVLRLFPANCPPPRGTCSTSDSRDVQTRAAVVNDSSSSVAKVVEPREPSLPLFFSFLFLSSISRSRTQSTVEWQLFVRCRGVFYLLVTQRAFAAF